MLITLICRLESVLQRTKLVRSVHELHTEIMALESELECLRMRTYPVLENASHKYKR